MRFRPAACAATALVATLVVACGAATFHDAPCTGCTEGGIGGEAGSDAMIDATLADGAVRDGLVSNSETGSLEAEAGPVGCPTKGGDMDRISYGSVKFCIDRIEVTGHEYNTFYQDAGKSLPIDLTSAVCVKASANQPPMGNDAPVTKVDWCDAWAFCKWAGKRLCSRVGGGAPLTDQGERADPSKNEWLFACSNSGSLVYPYGNGFDATLCNGSGSAPIPFDMATNKCIGGFAGLYDMSGNVAEWIDDCTAPVSNSCIAVGGSFGETAGQLTCKSEFMTVSRTHQDDKIGFRCCAD